MRVLIVAPFVHHLVRPAERDHAFGGTEVRALTWARLLAARGIDVTLGVSSTHATAPFAVGGVRCRTGVPYPTAWQQWQADAQTERLSRPVALGVRAVSAAVRRVRPVAPAPVRFHLGRPDAVVAFGCHPFSVGALLDAAADHRVFGVLALSNDSDLEQNDRQTPAHHKARALAAADLCAVQTAAQAERCAALGLRSVIVPNPLPDVGLDETAGRPPTKPYVLWVGRDTAQKQLPIAADLARAAPALPFVFIVDEPARKRAGLTLPDNVTVHGPTDFATTERFIAGARVLLNTSAHEGFPNAFLQAAAASVPIASLSVDPDGLLGERGAGLCAGGDPSRLLDETVRLFGDDVRRTEMGNAGRAYVTAHHDGEAVAAKIIRLLEDGVAQTRAAGATGRAQHTDEPVTSRVHYARSEIKRAYARAVPRVLAGRCDLSVLDFGAGHSPYRTLFAPFAKQYHSADIDNPEADLAIDGRGRVPLPDDAVDVVVSSQVLEHVPSPAAHLEEAHRLLRPDGVLFLSTHGTWPLHHDPLDLWRWTPDGLCSLFEASGFVVDDLIGIQGMAATGLQLVQDAVAARLPGRSRPLLYAPTQLAMRVLDAVTPSRLSRSNAAVFLVVAHAEPNR